MSKFIIKDYIEYNPDIHEDPIIFLKQNEDIKNHNIEVINRWSKISLWIMLLVLSSPFLHLLITLL